MYSQSKKTKRLRKGIVQYHSNRILIRNLITTVVVAERLRRWTRNPLGSSRAGSNPADNEAFAVLPHRCVAELLLLLFDNLKSQCTPNILCSSCVQQYKVLLIKRAYHYSTKKKVIARRMCCYFKVLVILSLSLFLFPEGGSVVQWLSRLLHTQKVTSSNLVRTFFHLGVILEQLKIHTNRTPQKCAKHSSDVGFEPYRHWDTLLYF